MKHIHELLGEGLIARHTDGIGCKVVADSSEDGFEVVRRLEGVSLVETDILDALPVPGNVRDLFEPNLTLRFVLPKEQALVAVEPNA